MKRSEIYSARQVTSLIVKPSWLVFVTRCNCGELYFALLGSLVPSPEESKISSEPQPTFQNGEIKQEEKIRVVDKLVFWEIVSTALFISLIISLIFLLKPKDEKKHSRIAQEHLTNEMLNNLKDPQKRDFSKIKSMLTDESKNIFEMFIESQFAYNDTVSINKIETFINTLQPLDWQSSRQIRYINFNNDTNYFKIYYIPNGDSF